MSRINVESKWWIDIRRSLLIKLLNNENTADGAAVQLWNIGQEYWKDNRGHIPRECFDLLPCAKELIQAKLAEYRLESNHTEANSKQNQANPTKLEAILSNEEQIESNPQHQWVYVKGALKFFDWTQKRRLAGKKGGVKSAEIRQLEFGTSQPSRSKLEAKPSKPEAKPSKTKQKQPSSSSSSSSSFSNTNTNTEESKGDYAVQELKCVVPDKKDLKVDATHPPPEASGSGKFIGAYVKAYQARYGATRPIISGKVQGQIKTLLQDVPVDRACQLIQVYMQMDTPWFVTKCHDFSTFIANLDPVGLALDTGENQGTAKINWEKLWGDINGSTAISATNE